MLLSIFGESIVIIFKSTIGLGILKIIVSVSLGASKINYFVCALSFTLKLVFSAVKSNKPISVCQT